MSFLQDIARETGKIISGEFGIMDGTGVLLACSDEHRIGSNHPSVTEVMASPDRFVILNGVSFNKVYIKNRFEYIIYIDPSDSDSDKDMKEKMNESAMKCLSLISLNIANAKLNYDEKYDKNSFIKNIIFNNIFPGDILLKSKELHVQYNANRAVFLIKTEKSGDDHVYNIIQGMFPNKFKDFILMLDDENTVLIKELKNDDYAETDNIARIISDTLNTELMIKVNIGIGTIVKSIKDIGRSLNEAKTSLLIGEIFEGEKNIFSYTSLGLGRLIYHIPLSFCELFMKESLKEGFFEAMDNETMYTIQKFFENNLNISEASRQLYVHRNTLVYRLDKIQKKTGLDIRKFDDAIIFKIAILVKKYIDTHR